jgi:ELWxxDGT repeat protein
MSPASVAQNTPQAIDIYQGVGNSSNPSGLTAIGNKLIFNAIASGTGKEPHLSDGTVQGTSIAQDVFAGTNSSNARYFTEFKIGSTTYAYYFANDASNSGALYRTNIANGATELVVNVNPVGSASSTPGAGNGEFLVNVGGTLFFSGQHPTGRQELFKSDGTANGTVLVKDINTTSIGGFTIGSDPENLTNVNGKLFFTADANFDGGASAVNRELWVSDGTTAGTYMVKDIHPSGSASPTNLIAKDGLCYFFANDGAGVALWKSDGTAAGTQKIALPQGTTINTTNGLGVAAGLLFFAATDATRGTELWYTQGGVANVIDLYPGSSSSNPKGFTQAGGDCYFSAVGEGTGAELWRSNGANASLVKDIQAGLFGSSPANLTTAKAQINGAATEVVYFTAFTATNGVELWKSDGTANGTVMVDDLNPSVSTNASKITGITAVPVSSDQDGIFFAGYDGDANLGTELWYTLTDGVTPPNPPVVGATSAICARSSAMLQASGAITGQKYRWYTVATGGTVVKESADENDHTYITPTLTTNSTFYVSIVSANGALESDRVPAEVIMLPESPAPVTNFAARCGAGQLVLTAVKANGTAVQPNEEFRWYNTEQGGSPIAVNNGSLTLILTTTTNFYVSFYNGVCESSRVQATGLITNFASLPKPTVNHRQICGVGQLALSAYSQAPVAIEYRWYDAATGGTLLQQSANPEYVANVSGSTTYYVTAYSADCGLESDRVALNVTYSPLTGGAIAQKQTIQAGGTPALITSEEDADGGFGYIRYQWESSTDGITWQLIVDAANKDYQPSALTQTTYFRRLASTAECGQTESNVGMVEVVPPLNAPTFTGQIAAVDTVWAVKLNWQNNDNRTQGFYLEKGDGVNFSPLATLAASDSSYIDFGSILGDKAYYRIRAFAGTVLSAYVMIRIAPDNNNPSTGGEAGAQTAQTPEENTLIYPNPVREVANVKVDMPENGQGEMILRSNEGRAVLRSSFNKTSNDDTFTLQMQSIKPGIYWLEIIMGDKRIVKRMIKN